MPVGSGTCNSEPEKGPSYMSDKANLYSSVNNDEHNPTDFRQAHHLLVNGELKSARKIRGRWVANCAALLREMGA